MITTALLQGGAAAELFGLLILVAQIALVVWTYLDAKKNSSHPAFIWAIVVLLAPLLGLIAYVILGRNS